MEQLVVKLGLRILDLGDEELDLSGTNDFAECPARLLVHSNLKVLTLSSCKQLVRLTRFRLRFDSMTQLILRDCHLFVEFPECTGNFSMLELLDMTNCTSLQTLPADFGKLRNLKTLILAGCDNLQGLPESFGDLSSLDLLDLNGLSRLQALPSSICRLQSLREISFRAYQMGDFSILGQIPFIRTVHFSRVNTLQLASVLLQLSDVLTDVTLESIDIDQAIEVAFYTMVCLRKLRLLDCAFTTDQLSRLFLPGNQLQVLHIMSVTITELCDLNLFPNLVELRIECPALASLPLSIGDLKMLKRLLLVKCRSLREIVPEIGSLINLNRLCIEAHLIKQLPPSIGSLQNLTVLDLQDCSRLQSIPPTVCSLHNLELVDLDGCVNLHTPPSEFFKCNSLQAISFHGTPFYQMDEWQSENIKNAFDQESYRRRVLLLALVGYRSRRLRRRGYHLPPELWIMVGALLDIYDM
jgi:Leucine-rich repeat (LRR) protein